MKSDPKTSGVCSLHAGGRDQFRNAKNSCSITETQAYFKGEQETDDCAILPLAEPACLAPAAKMHFLNKGDAINLVERRDAGKYLLQGGFAQAGKTFGLSRAPHF